MWIFGHLGLGRALTRPLTRELPTRWVLLGTLLPDLIDKPLFLIARGLDPASLISCTRTFGHSGLFLLTLSLAAYLRKSTVLRALAIGTGSHLLLDGLQDLLSLTGSGPPGESSLLFALLFPLHEFRFASYPFHDFHPRLNPVVIVGELLGVSILFQEFIRPRFVTKRRTPRA